MILHPAIVALVLVSFLNHPEMPLPARFSGSGSSRGGISPAAAGQAVLEGRTYLISPFVSYVFVFQIGSPFLYIYTADMSSQTVCRGDVRRRRPLRRSLRLSNVSG